MCIHLINCIIKRLAKSAESICTSEQCTILIPALIHSVTAVFDSSLGGSIIAIKPKNAR